MSVSKEKRVWKLSEFVAHSSTVNCLAISPSDGRMLVTGGEDRRINLWTVGQPNAITSISGITSPVWSVGFNNTENWIGAGSKSGVIKVFDLEENKTVRSISGHKAAVSSLDFHRYGDILASGSMDTNLKLWDVRRKGCIITYKGHTEAINCIQFSPDGKWVVSASSDSTVKLWDLSAGRMIKEFKAHTAAVNSIQFHPKEVLLATGSSDRTAKFWDLETMSLVSETRPESSAVRCVRYHGDGTALFSGGQDSLRVHGWEPAVTHDMLSLQCGRVADMAVSGEQLIMASSAQTNVSLWCVDLKQLQPFSGERASNAPAADLSASGRRQFEYQQQLMERPHTQATGPAPPPAEPHPPSQVEPRSPPRSPKEGGDDSPPIQLNVAERKQLFAARQKLVRTPPKHVPSPFSPPPDDPLPPPRLPPLSEPPSTHMPAAKPDIRDFKAKQPPVVHASSASRLEGRIVSEIQTNHIDMCQMLNSRLSVLKKARSQWSVSEPKNALEVVINSGNQSAIVDALSVMHLKRTLWTLDMAVVVLPELGLMLKSKYPSYSACACSVIKLLLKSFGPVIRSNLASPPAQGDVDIMREERYGKCQTCHSHLVSLREEAWSLSRDSRPAGRIVKEQGLLEAFSVLD